MMPYPGDEDADEFDDTAEREAAARDRADYENDLEWAEKQRTAPKRPRSGADDLQILVEQIADRIVIRMGARPRADLAAATGITLKRLSRLLAGAIVAGPDPIETLALARELGCSPSWLLWGRA